MAKAGGRAGGGGSAGAAFMGLNIRNRLNIREAIGISDKLGYTFISQSGLDDIRSGFFPREAFDVPTERFNNVARRLEDRQYYSARHHIVHPDITGGKMGMTRFVVTPRFFEEYQRVYGEAPRFSRSILSKTVEKQKVVIGLGL